jgi:predicted ATPase
LDRPLEVTLISLNRLPRRLRAEMIAHITGGKALPEEIADQITDRTDGVPLFIEELTKALVASGDRQAATGDPIRHSLSDQF